MAVFQGVSLAAVRERAEAEVAGSISDHELMERVARGDKTAFALLTSKHLRTMVGVAQRLLGNAAEADEIAQESFLRLWRYAPKWDPKGTGSVKTWLNRVVTNLCFDTLRRRRSVPLDEAEEIEDTANGPFEILKAEDRKAMVQKLLSALPERQRIAIVCAYFEDMSGQEIAETLGASVGAVESLLVRGREGLRKGLKELGLVWGEDL